MNHPEPLDAWIHFHLAGRYDPVAASISEGTLFRIEAVAAALSAVLILTWRKTPADLFAWLTAAAGLIAILAYRYWDIGLQGPLPDMYEPIWFAEKAWALAGQALAVAALTPILITAGRSRFSGRRSAPEATR